MDAASCDNARHDKAQTRLGSRQHGQPSIRTILISPVTLLQKPVNDLLGTFPKFAQDFRWFKDIKNDSTENLTYFSRVL